MTICAQQPISVLLTGIAGRAARLAVLGSVTKWAWWKEVGWRQVSFFCKNNLFPVCFISYNVLFCKLPPVNKFSCILIGYPVVVFSAFFLWFVFVLFCFLLLICFFAQFFLSVYCFSKKKKTNLIALFWRNLQINWPWLGAEKTGTTMRVLVEADKLETNYNMTLKWFPRKEYNHWLTDTHVFVFILLESHRHAFSLHWNRIWSYMS